MAFTDVLIADYGRPLLYREYASPNPSVTITNHSLSEQMGMPLDQVPHNYGEYFDFLNKLGVQIWVNRTMLWLYEIEPSRLAPTVFPVSLDEMVKLFEGADCIIVY